MIGGCLVVLLLNIVAWRAQAVRCPQVVFIVHSNTNNDHVTDFMSTTFLRDTNLILMSGHDSAEATVASRRNLRMRKVLYDGNPGGQDKTFKTEGKKYLGTHRTMAGILAAMDTHPDADWVYVLDDDNVVNADMVCEVLSRLNPTIPLFLGYVGPKRTHGPCRSTSTPTEWTCCTDVKKPCLANVTSPFRTSQFKYDETLKTMVPHDCALPSSHCCSVVPWPEGVGHGYPYRLRRKEDTHDELAYPTNMAGLYPYGGATYAISKAMLHAVGRDTWEKHMYRLQCTNADINVATTILSAGYSIHQYDHVFSQNFAPHHVHTIKEQFDSFSVTRQPKEVIAAACAYPNITGHVGTSHRRICK